jgi:anti-sigma factor RsiW
VNDPIPVGEDDLQAALDGQLPADRAAIVAAYLDQHADIAERHRADAAHLQRLRASLDPVADEPIPARLWIAHVTSLRRERLHRGMMQIAAAALLLFVGGLAGWSARPLLPGPAGRDAQAMTADAVAAFKTYTPELVHPVEVRAAEGPQLARWLSGRLERTIVTPDLSADGFRLMGGRILPDGDRQAALLMYDDDHGTRLTIYLHLGTVEGTELRYSESGGVQTVFSSEKGLTYAVTARASRARLLAVAQDIERQLTGVAAEHPT